MTAPQPSSSEPLPATAARRVAAAAIVLAGFFVIGLLYAFVMQGKRPGLEGDYIGYWASAQLLAHHANPFDSAALLRLQTACGYDRVAPSITPSPPVTFLLLLPLGFVGAWLGLILWGMAMVAALAASIWMIWARNGRPDTLLPLLGMAFAPALVAMLGGQIGIFLLFGLAGFLYFVQHRPFVAGLFLLFCAMKPHLMLAFAVAFLLWAFDTRKGRIALAGFVLALALSTAVTLALDPHVFAHYAASLHEAGVAGRVTPTLPMLLQQSVAPKAAWIEFLPMFLTCVWAAWLYLHRRATWNWMSEGMLVLLVARLCAPYAWFSDEVIVLPAVLTALFHARALRRPSWPFAIVFAASLVQVFQRIDMKTYAYVWTAPAWLLCYLYATRTQKSREPEPAAT